MPACRALGCTAYERKALLRVHPANVPEAGVNLLIVKLKLFLFDNSLLEVFGQVGSNLCGSSFRCNFCNIVLNH